MTPLSRLVDLSGITRFVGRIEGGGTPAVAVVSKRLTSADILALTTAPIEVLPAPGGRFYYVPQLAIFHYRFGTTPYAGDASGLGLIFGDTVAQIVPGSILYAGGIAGSPYSNPANFDAADLLAQTEDAYLYVPFGVGGGYCGWLRGEVENLPVSVVSSNAFTVGDGTLSVRLFYGLIDGAP